MARVDSISRLANKLDYQGPSSPKHPSRRERIIGVFGVVSFLIITVMGCLMFWEGLGRRRDPGALTTRALLIALGVGGIVVFIRIWQGRFRL